MLQQMTEAARRNPKLGTFAIAKRLDVQEQIQAARKTLPQCRFHDTRCAVGLKSLRHYHREWDEEKRKFEDRPVHDWASHGASAFMTVSLTWRFGAAPITEESFVDTLLRTNPVRQPFKSYVDRFLRKRRLAREEAAL